MGNVNLPDYGHAVVVTRNRKYVLILLGDYALISGHPEYCPDFKRSSLPDITLPGRMVFRTDDGTIISSPVQEVHVLNIGGLR